ncbi:unnamed protein product [Periconia digitata]|uniref:NAD(P)-binding protein n=1 Tax=Periconia digitata TaxID=1303443 RepID=A0A9W4UGP5_9PLEO|nr:unnamed protein product [Periconia digitata]
MVQQLLIQQSNKSLASTHPNLTAIFVGGTSGIGLYTLTSLAKYCPSPKIYIIGRSQAAADNILSFLHDINANGKYLFLRADVSLITEVDRICQTIMEKEEHVNILFLSQGVMTMGEVSKEDLHVPASLILHSRMRLILNLLPLLRTAPTLRRVVTVFAGTKAGPVFAPTDIEMRELKNPMKARGQAVCALTMLLEEAKRRAPEVGFVHSYPGFVKTGIGRGGGIVRSAVMAVVGGVLGPFLFVGSEECGERHLFLATTGRFAGVHDRGLEVREDGEVAMGTDGVFGSGVYCTNEVCESGGDYTVKMLKKARELDSGEWPWNLVRKDYVRITGKECL